MPGILESIAVQGEKAFKDALRARQKAVQSALDPGVKAASTIVRDEAKRTTAFRDRSGQLRAAIKSKRVKKKGYTVKWKVAPDGRKAPHGHLVEKGHAIVRGGKTVGEVPPHVFLEIAAKASDDRAVAEIQAVLVRAVDA